MMRLIDAVLAGGVASLEQHHQPPPARDDPLLQVHELGLQAQQLLLVLLGGRAPSPRGKLDDRGLGDAWRGKASGGVDHH